MSAVLPFPQARRAVEDYAKRVRPAGAETLALLEAPGRVLAEEIVADRELPPFPRATRDGYAVAAVDVAQPPARLQVVGEVRAGVAPDAISLQWGQAAEIMTGAPVPAGADTVVMIEYTRRDGDVVEVSRSAAAGENVVPAGAEARRGEILLRPGARLTPAAIALAASVGRAQLRVHKRPRVAILATGDEIVEVAVRPGPAQIRNSNSYSLAAQVAQAGGEPIILPVAPDEPARLRQLVEEGLATDLLLLTGGVSMGKYDLVEPVLAELGADFFFTGALIQPGRPVVFGDAPGRPEPATATGNWKLETGNLRSPFFGLPGNPVSTMVCFELFARAILEALAGATPSSLVFLQAKLKSEITTKTGLTRFLPALLSGEFERAEVERGRWQGSGDIAATARANCYIVVPPDRERLAAGELVSVLLT
jgi:molybdopterin molybdotransferase